KTGEVPTAKLDDAVRRVLEVKQALGLFDNPYRSLDPAREAADLTRPEHRALAREAARRSIVMLRNERRVLPISRGAKVALIGPFAEAPGQLDGPWTLFAEPRESVTLADGIRAALGAPTQLTVVSGSGFDGTVDGGIRAAVAAAKVADVVLLA